MNNIFKIFDQLDFLKIRILVIDISKVSTKEGLQRTCESVWMIGVLIAIHYIDVLKTNT